MSLFSKEKQIVLNHDPAVLAEDIQDLVKIVNLFDSMIAGASPEINVSPKYQAMKNILRKLNSKYLKKGD